MKFSLWKSRPKAGAIVATIGVRCEDDLHGPAVDVYFSLVATPAVHRTDSFQDHLLSKHDLIEIDRRVVLLVDRQDVGAPDNNSLTGILEISYRARNIKFHRHPVTRRPNAAESKVAICC